MPNPLTHSGRADSLQEFSWALSSSGRGWLWPGPEYAPSMSMAASGLKLPSFFQSAMVMFDLAWMMSKDMNDMLWYVASSRGHSHSWLPSSSSVRPVRAGSGGRCHHLHLPCSHWEHWMQTPFWNVQGPGFLSNREAVRAARELSGVERAWPVQRVRWWGLCTAASFLFHCWTLKKEHEK